MITTLLIKNFKIILRNPFTIILLILFPVILMLLIGISYSGNELIETKIGYIGTSENIFVTMKSLQFITFKGTIEEQKQNCINKLKKSELELCVEFESQKDSKGNFLTASAVYYIDNTRPQLSQMLVESFNGFIDYQTKTISKKNIKEVFAEINDTVEFMKNSSKLIDELVIELDSGLKSITEIESVLNLTITNYNYASKEFLIHSEELEKNLDSFSTNIKRLESDLNELEKGLNSSMIETTTDSLEEILADLRAYSLVNPAITSYVSLNEFEQNINSLNSFINTISQTKGNIQNILKIIKNFDDVDELSSKITEIKGEVTKISEYLLEGQKEIGEIKQKVSERREQILIIQREINSKTEYFEEISSRNVGEITEPIKKTNTPLFKNFKRIHSLAPSVVVLVLLFVGLLLSNVIVSQEINSKAYLRNLLSPVKQHKFIFSLYLTAIIIVIFELLFLFLILELFFGISIFSKLSPLLIVCIHLLTIFVLIGIILAYSFNTVAVSILTTTFVMLIMFLLSDIIVPLEIMPRYVYNILIYSPVVIGGHLIRQIFFFENFVLSLSQLIMIYGEILSLVILLYIFVKRRKKKNTH